MASLIVLAIHPWPSTHIGDEGASASAVARNGVLRVKIAAALPATGYALATRACFGELKTSMPNVRYTVAFSGYCSVSSGLQNNA